MMGQKIMDPHKIESNIEEISGLGILPIETVMEKSKTTTQYTDTLKNVEESILEGAEGISVTGYEIHQGYSYLEEDFRIEKSQEETNKECIFGGKDLKGMARGNVVGTYVHGIFDNSDFTNYFLNRIREKKGLDKTDENFSFSEYKNREYDKLAQVLRENLDLKKIYEIMEIEK